MHDEDLPIQVNTKHSKFQINKPNQSDISKERRILCCKEVVVQESHQKTLHNSHYKTQKPLHLLQFPQLPRLNKFLLNLLPLFLRLMNPPFRSTLLLPRPRKLKFQLRNMTPIHLRLRHTILLLLTLRLLSRSKTRIGRTAIRRLILNSDGWFEKTNPFLDMLWTCSGATWCCMFGDDDDFGTFYCVAYCG